MHLAAEAAIHDATVSTNDPFTLIVLVACGIGAVAMIGLVGIALATLFGRADR